MIENNLISIQVEKEITSLFKSYLEILECLEVDHRIMMKKLDQHTTDGFSDNINYLTKEKHDAIRKLLLDKGNDSIRNLLNFLNCFDFQINPVKLQEVTNKQTQYKTTKKIIISSMISEKI